MPFLFILLQTATPPAAPGLSSLGQFLPIVLMIAIFYFLVFMPMRKQQKNTKEMIKALQNGQTLLTSSGIIGTIVAVNDYTLILRINPDNLKLQISRNSVTSLVAEEQSQK